MAGSPLSADIPCTAKRLAFSYYSGGGDATPEHSRDDLMQGKPDMANGIDLSAMLARTLEDARLSRNERQALRAALAEMILDDEALVRHRQQALALARDTLNDPQAVPVLEWLVDVLSMLAPRPERSVIETEAYFSPGHDCARQVANLIDRTKRLLDICVFTITDDRISNAIHKAHQRGVQVRIITDDDKSADLGSDIDGLRDAGIAVRMDRSPAHMHHKFALFDAERLLLGSYNWTRGAATLNRENLILVNTPRLRDAFQGEFEQLWRQFQ
jgi:mitochondrial cardiolipin hydrolase